MTQEKSFSRQESLNDITNILTTQKQSLKGTKEFLSLDNVNTTQDKFSLDEKVS